MSEAFPIFSVPLPRPLSYLQPRLPEYLSSRGQLGYFGKLVWWPSLLRYFRTVVFCMSSADSFKVQLWISINKLYSNRNKVLFLARKSVHCLRTLCMDNKCLFPELIYVSIYAQIWSISAKSTLVPCQCPYTYWKITSPERNQELNQELPSSRTDT